MSRRELEGKEGETVIMHWVQRGKKRLQREFRMGGGGCWAEAETEAEERR